MKIIIKKAEKESWTVDEFVQKYKQVLADKECEYLKNYNYKIANFNMLPQPNKRQQLNEIIAQNPLE